MNRCLDDGIAQAVKLFCCLDSRKSAMDAIAKTKVQDDTSLNRFASMTYFIEAAVMAATAIRTGKLGPNGATAGVLDQSLKGLQTLIAEVVDNTPA